MFNVQNPNSVKTLSELSGIPGKRKPRGTAVSTADTLHVNLRCRCFFFPSSGSILVMRLCCSLSLQMLPNIVRLAWNEISRLRVGSIPHRADKRASSICSCLETMAVHTCKEMRQPQGCVSVPKNYMDGRHLGSCFLCSG